MLLKFKGGLTLGFNRNFSSRESFYFPVGSLNGNITSKSTFTALKGTSASEFQY